MGNQSVAAQAILDQFELAKRECQDPANLNVWYPILGLYGPALIKQCENAIELSRILVADWLQSYMFGKEKRTKTIAKGIANYLSDHAQFKTHARHINRDNAKSKGLVIEDLERDQTFQDLVLSTFHATTHTFGGTGTVKIIENHMGKSFIKQIISTPMTPAPPHTPGLPEPPK